MTYEQMQSTIFSEALAEGFAECGENHAEDAYQHANEAVYEWSNEFPKSTFNPEEHS